MGNCADFYAPSAGDIINGEYIGVGGEGFRQLQQVSPCPGTSVSF
jgi:hypothetical protein